MAIEGADQLLKALGDLPRRVSRPIVIDALLEGGEPIRRMATQLAPRDPGAPDLADNINIAALRKRPDEGQFDFSVGIGTSKGFFYDWFNEMGTVDQSARPFYRPAFDVEAPKALGIIGAAIWRELAGRGVTRSVSTASRPFSGDGGDVV